MDTADPFGPIAVALSRVGELLAARGDSASIVVVGGAAMNLHGFVHRATTDVDVIAVARQHDPVSGTADLARPPAPLPEGLLRAVRTVARDLGLREDWLNAGPASQWDLGLPEGLETRISWRSHAALEVGLVGRLDLIFLKLYAAADDIGPKSVHYQDLLALRPTPEELAAAEVWIIRQTRGPEFADTVRKVVEHVLADTR